MSPAIQTLIYFIVLNAPRSTIQVNLTLLMDIIHCGDKYQHFRNFPILAAHNTLFEIQDFIIDLQVTYQRPTYILTEKKEDFYLRYHIFSPSLVLVFFRGMSEAVFERTDTLTRGRRLMSVLFVLLRPPRTYHEIHEILLHTWSNKYMHAILLYRDTHGQDHLLSFESYPEFKTKNLINAYRASDIFALRSKGNLHGYKIRSPVKSDVPRVFRVTDYNGRSHIKGYGYQLFMAFVKHRNGTFEEYITTNTSESVERKDIFRLISAGEIEISLHPTAMRDFMEVGSSYPIRLNDLCLMIPMANEIPSYMYLRRPFHFSAWILLVFGTFYLALTLMWIPPNSDHRQGNEFGLSFLQSVGHMLNMPSWNYYYNVTWKYFFAHSGAWFLGFITTTYYCALLESFLTSTVFGPQIDTMDDLIASGLKVLVTYNDLEDSAASNYLPKKFRKLFVGTTIDSLAEHRNRFNTSYAYVVAVDRWNFLNLQQQYLRRPIFRLSHICFLKHHLAYLLAYDSRLTYSLNYFILYLQQSGLMEHWERVEFKYAAREGYVRFMMDSYEVQPMHSENMRLAWEVFGIGLVICITVFIVEVLLFAKWWRHLCLLLAMELGKATKYVFKIMRKLKM